MPIPPTAVPIFSNKAWKFLNTKLTLLNKIQCLYLKICGICQNTAASQYHLLGGNPFFSTFGRNTKLQTSLIDKLEYGIHDQRDRLTDSSNTLKDFQTEESMVIFHN